MKVALVHDDLVQWGGAERVLLGISEVFPEAPIYTTIFDHTNKVLAEKFKDKEIKTSFLQRYGKSLYKPSFFLHGLAFEQFDFTGFDLVISSTTRFAKAVITKPQTKHISYCHTPPRFLWEFSGESSLIPGRLKNYLKKYDLITSKRVDKFLAGSKNAQVRIKQIYGLDSDILYPFINLPRDIDVFDGGYFLVISRLNRYKNVDLIVKAFNKLGWRLKIIGRGPELSQLQRLAKSNIEFISNLDDQKLANLLAGCRGLVVGAEEDFGLTPLEAQAFGKGVAAYGKGGVRETVTEETGVFFDELTVESLVEALEKFINKKISPEKCLAQANKFSFEKFKDRLLELTS